MFNCEAQNNNITNLSIDIPEVALLSLKSLSSGVVNLAPQAPDEAGMALNFSLAHSNDIWINYSSILNSNNHTNRQLNAMIDGEIPDGLQLKLIASSDAGYGKGQVGIPTGEITLSSTKQEIISGIGSCYTGVGLNKGHLLTYYLEMNNDGLYSSLQNNSFNLTVKFTLSDGE